MTTARRVTMIPAVETFTTVSTAGNLRLKRVAAYARVSTDNEEQLLSYEA